MSRFQSISLPSLSSTASMSEVENEVRKMGLDILQKLNVVSDAQFPVGYVYTQYPGQSAPADLFGGTWLNITSLYAGSFFRAEGGNSLAFNAGVQLDAFQGHYHSIYVSLDYAAGTAKFATGPHAGTSGYYDTLVRQPTTDGTNGTPRTANETRPVNQSIRIWQKTGGSTTASNSTTVNSGIYDSGTNANGSWIRFTDGTMMCWGITNQNFATSTASGTIFTGTSPAVTFPMPFVDALSVVYATNKSGIWATQGVTTASTFTFNTFYTSSVAASARDYSWQAIGKWK